MATLGRSNSAVQLSSCCWASDEGPGRLLGKDPLQLRTPASWMVGFF